MKYIKFTFQLIYRIAGYGLLGIILLGSFYGGVLWKNRQGGAHAATVWTLKALSIIMAVAFICYTIGYLEKWGRKKSIRFAVLGGLIIGAVFITLLVPDRVTRLKAYKDAQPLAAAAGIAYAVFTGFFLWPQTNKDD